MKRGEGSEPAKIQVRGASAWRWGRFVRALTTGIGLVGTTISAVNWLREKPEHAVVYSIQPVAISIVRRGETPRLSVSFDGQPIEGDVSMLRVALWNAGRSAVRPDDILEPIRIAASPNARLLDAKVPFQTRGVVGATLTPSDTGDVNLGLRILEPEDGLIVQLVYASPADLRPVVSGTLVGQRTLYQVALQGSPARIESQPIAASKRTMRVATDVVVKLIGLFMLMVGYWKAAEAIAKRRRTGKLANSLGTLLIGLLWLAAIGCGGLLAALAVTAIKSAPVWGPPFPF